MNTDQKTFSRNGLRPRGAAAVLAMLFLVIFTTLCVAMMSLASANVQSAASLADVGRAQDSAESGLRWMQYRLQNMQRPKTTAGNITAAVAQSLWPTLRNAIQNDFAAATINGQTNWNQLQTASERNWTVTSNDMTSSSISLDETGEKFVLRIQPHPIYSGDPLDGRYLRIISTGSYRTATRSVSMDFKIDKKIKFAIVGKVPIQLGRNTIVEGNVAMSTASKYPAIHMLSDFTQFDSALATKIQNFETFLRNKHNGYDGRININNAAEYSAAINAGYTDYNVDGYIDEYDLFARQYDSNGDRKVSQSEFTKSSTQQLYETNLFPLIDNLGGPLYAGDPTRAGLNDNIVDNRDAYAKVRGTISLTTTADAWNNTLKANNQTISDFMQGPVVPTDAGSPPIKFGASTTDMIDLSPANFDQCAEHYRNLSGAHGGTTSKTSSVIKNATITSTDANSSAVVEKTPYGSTTYQATYQRPVFKNMTFVNCTIAKGTNALFDNCTFQGVTFVDMTHDITNSSTHSGGSIVGDKDAGMTWSKAMKKVGGSTPTFANTTTLTSTNSYGFADGNNLRFNNCTFNGPVAGPAATAYTHFTNSWEFTGATLFNNQADQTATIVCPNTNIEMGSFTNPGEAPSTLVGVVVVGNIDIRGTSNVDGAIIVTGDGAGNTTLGYFGADDGASNPSAMPEGGFGRLDVRYNPYRALPDGINIAIDVLPDPNTYREGAAVAY